MATISANMYFSGKDSASSRSTILSSEAAERSRRQRHDTFCDPIGFILSYLICEMMTSFKLGNICVVVWEF